VGKNFCMSKLGKVCRLFDTLRIGPKTHRIAHAERSAWEQGQIRKEEVGALEPCRLNPGLLLHPSEEEELPLSQPCAARVVPLFLSVWLASLARDHAWREWLFLVLEFEPPKVEGEEPGRDP